MSTESTPTTASEWRSRREQGIEITLPEYGDVVSIRPMDAGFFIKTGRVPDFLTSTVQDMINLATNSVKVPTELSEEDMERWLTWLDELVKWVFVSPKVVDEPHGEDEIGVNDIGLFDKLHIYRLFGQPAQVLRGFRRLPAKPVVSVDATENNGTQAVNAA